MKKIILILVLLLILIPITVNAARGCCSHHGGVSHCGSSGKYICNDGTTSPSCTCSYTYYKDTPSTNNTTSNNTSPVQEEPKEEQVKEEPTNEKQEESQEKEEDQPKLIINKNDEIIKNTEENKEGSLLELLPIAIPGSIAAIAYEKSRKKN